MKGGHWIPLSECIGYSADDRVKLSFHPDGFVQFSGENSQKILSGRDAVTGEPKGLGIVSNPLSHPVRTGPTFGISAWGLKDFEELGTTRNAIVSFPQKEMYYRGCLPGEQNGIHLEAFVFEKRYWSGVSGEPDALKISLCVGMFEATGAALELKVIPIQNSTSFIGVMANHVRMSFPEESGFTLNGPSESTKASQKNALMALYPASVRDRLQKYVKVSKNLNYGF